MRVIGVGNRWRSDDAAGLHVARRLLEDGPAGADVLEREGEPAGLIEAFAGTEALVVVDAVSSGSPPGTIHRVEAGEAALPAEVFGASTHLLGLAEAIELARALGRLPKRVVVYGIEGRVFEAGEQLSPEVEDAVERVAIAVREEVERCTNGR